MCHGRRAEHPWRSVGATNAAAIKVYRPIGRFPSYPAVPRCYPERVAYPNAKRGHGVSTGMPVCLSAIRMLCDVARLCNEPRSVQDIASRVLTRVCEFNGWFAGSIHAVDASGCRHQIAGDTRSDARAGSIDGPERLSDALLDELGRTGEPVWQRTAFTSGLGREVTGMAAPIRTNRTLLGAIVLLSEARAQPDGEIRSAVETVATLLAGLLERDALHRTIADLATEEQRRIGRELHDSVSQHLSGAALIGDGVAKRLTQAGHDDADNVRRITHRIRGTLGTIHRITEGLIPQVLDGDGLGVAIERMIEAAAQRSRSSISVRGRPPDLPERIARELFFVVNEAVRNALSHANASKIEIRWSLCRRAPGEVVSVEIRDNGSGIPEGTGYRTGRGVAIMRHRTSLINGTLEIASPASGGTSVRCLVPLTPAPGDPSGTEVPCCPRPRSASHAC